MIKVKDRTVCVWNLPAALWHALYQYEALRKSHGINSDVVITSGNDGRHSHGSKHHGWDAVDARSKDVPQGVMETIVGQLSRNLGLDFDVVWEQVGNPNEHLHIELHPKQR